MKKLLGGGVQLGGATTPSAKLVSVALAVAALVLWGFAGWPWWVLLPLLGGGVVVRLLVWLFFEPWRDWAGPAVLGVVIVFLMWWTTGGEQLIAFGAIAVVLAWHLRMTSPKWLRWVPLVLGLAAVIGGGLIEFVSWANNKTVAQQQDTKWREAERARLFPDTPRNFVTRMVEAIWSDEKAQNDGCINFSPEGQAAFAAAYGVAQCEDVWPHLRSQITDRGSYVNDLWVKPDTGVEDTATGRAEVDGCHLIWGGGLAADKGAPGPQLGHLTLEQVMGQGWRLVGYRACPPPPPGDPGPMPAEPQTVLDGLVGYLAKGDAKGACHRFSPEGQAAFAAAYDAADCPAAVAAAHAQINDPDRYKRPVGGIVRAAGPAGADGSIPVDGCELTWTSMTADGRKPPPGPQPGRLVVTAAPSGGYWITGYQQC